jgi:alkylated DNA repair dioxygenase AlkB
VSPDPLASGIDLTEAFERTAAEGFAFVPAALNHGFRRRLHREIRGAPFVPAPETVGQVHQETEACTLSRALEGYPVVAELREALTAAARASRVRGLRTWRPDDVAVQRYHAGSMGITSHRDGKRFRRLVAVVTIAGTAAFTVRRERHGDVMAHWEAGPGSLVLLRGPGLAGARDGRPFHEVSGPLEGVRYSVGFRMERATWPGAAGLHPSGPR